MATLKPNEVAKLFSDAIVQTAIENKHAQFAEKFAELIETELRKRWFAEPFGVVCADIAWFGWNVVAHEGVWNSAPVGLRVYTDPENSIDDEIGDQNG